jgi:hypothetical protein
MREKTGNFLQIFASNTPKRVKQALYISLNLSYVDVRGAKPLKPLAIIIIIIIIYLSWR